MHIRAVIVIGTMAVAGIALGGCATGGGGGTNSSFMSQCDSRATTQAERNQCAWENGARNASGR